MRSCATCVFAEPCIGDDDRPRMDCRRYPPGVIFDGASPAIVWPQVGDGDWCGEWQVRPEVLEGDPDARCEYCDGEACALCTLYPLEEPCEHAVDERHGDQFCPVIGL